MVIPYRHDQRRDITQQFTDSDEALGWLEQELPNLASAVRFAADHGYPAMAWQIVDALWPLFLRRGHYRERLELDQVGLAAARASGDATAEAKMLNRFGLALIKLGRLDEAAGCFRQALAIWRGAGSDYRVASSLRRLGLIERARNRTERALALFMRALDGVRVAGDRELASGFGQYFHTLLTVMKYLTR